MPSSASSRTASTLPAPDADERARSAMLAARIRDAVAAAGGWLPFDRYMAMALYEPGLGYYAGPQPKFGAGGDFVTAPGLGPLFGRCVAAQLAQWFRDAPDLPRRVVEFGGGDGTLAADLLEALDAEGLAPDEYAIVELSGALRARQVDTLARRVPALAGRVTWWDALPERIEGCVIGNEVLDAMPVRLFRATEGAVLERGVLATGTDTDGAPAFAFDDRPADPAFERAVATVLDGAMPGWRDAGPGFDYVSEWPEQATAWMRELGARLAHGALLLVDYGFPRAEFLHPQRRGGTLMCHRLHHAHPDPLVLPGLQDITAHVDFSAVMEAGEEAGLRLAGYTTQAHFLLGCGLLEAFGSMRSTDPVGNAKLAAAVQRLMSEAEMGELFKAIAFTRGPGLDGMPIGFARGDRSGRL